MTNLLNFSQYAVLPHNIEVGRHDIMLNLKNTVNFFRPQGWLDADQDEICYVTIGSLLHAKFQPGEWRGALVSEPQNLKSGQINVEFGM